MCMCVCVCVWGGGGYKLGLLRGYNQVFFSFFSPELGCFECSLRCFLLLYVHISLFFCFVFPFNRHFFKFIFWWGGGGGGGGGGSELFRPKYENKGEITQSRVYNFFIETCSRNMFTSLMDVNLSPTKLARYTKIFF